MSKIAVLSYSGKVGKTTIAAHLLSPRMNNATIFAIETQNETASSLGLDVSKMAGEKYSDLYKKLLTIDDAIIDVGASNIENFLEKMLKIDESHIEFDYFIVPVINDPSIQRECLRTIGTLHELGVPAAKIKVVFNRVEADPEEEFPAIFGFAKQTKQCTAKPAASIFENEIYPMLAAKKISMGKVLDDPTDYRALLRAKNGSDKEMGNYAEMQMLKGFARGANKNLDTVFEALFPK